MNGKFAKLLALKLFGPLFFFAATLGPVYGLMHLDARSSVATARSVIESLSKRWRFGDIAQDFEPAVLAKIDIHRAQRIFARYRDMGRLKQIRDRQLSNYRVDYMSAEGLRRHATLRMVAQFENGEAVITLILVTTGSVAKVQHLQIKPIWMPKPEARRRVA